MQRPWQKTVLAVALVTVGVVFLSLTPRRVAKPASLESAILPPRAFRHW